MHKKRSKRRERIQLTFVYTLMAIAVVSIVAILVLVIQGYRYNRFDGKLEQGGLVQFNSKPSGATVMVDDVTLSNKTASKVTLTSGNHTISMSRDGFSSWKKSVVVKPGSVLWLNYARLFPTSPSISTAEKYATVSSAIPSTNHEIMAVIAKPDVPEITLTPLNDDTPASTKLVIPVAAYMAPAADMAQSFTLLAWDKDSDRVLLRHTYGDKSEYISIDIRDGKARNISVELGLDITDTQYSLGGSNVLYALTATHELRRIDLGASTVSKPLATNVAEFSTTEERVVTYTTLANEKGVRAIGYVTSGSTESKTLATYEGDATTPLHVATGNYYGDHYLVVLHGSELLIKKGYFPASDNDTAPSLTKVASLNVAGGGDYVGFAPGNNRMVYVAKGATVVTYDLELSASATVSLQDPLTSDVQWLDSYHIFAVGQNGYYYDYDGTNGQLFASNTSNFPVVLSKNDKYIYYFTASESGAKLQRVDLSTD